MIIRALYLFLGLLVIGGYAYAGWNGLELGRTKRGYAPKSVRGTGGTAAVYYGGYRGGK